MKYVPASFLAALVVLVQPLGLSQAPVNSSPPEGPTSTLQARSNLVVLDVVVVDRSHSPIHNLKAADFQVREGGVAQTVKSFEEHTRATAVGAAPMAPLPPGVFTNYTATPMNGPVNILLIDRLNTPVASQPYLHDQIVSFLQTIKPGTQLAIFGLTTQLIYLQGFTADPSRLLAAMQSKKNGTRQSALLNPVRGTNTESVGDSLESLKGSFPDASGLDAMIANARQFEAQQASDRTQQRGRLTLEAMNLLARYLTAIPGRKNLIWFSGSFPISIQPDTTGDLKDSFAVAADMSDQFRETTGLMSRGQVSVYPIDARGLQTLPMLDASVSTSGRSGRTATEATKDNNAFIQQTNDEQSTMRQMARDTGGQAFVNTNGLAEAVGAAIELGSTYYTVTYTPTDTNYDGHFRKIQVDVPQQRAELSYRRGYYADAPNAGPRRRQLTRSPSAPPSAEHQAVVSAMLRGAPGSTQILFKVLVVPAGAATDATVADGNVVSPNVQGPFRRYAVNYAAVAQDIALQTVAPGSYRAHLEFVVYVYNAEGVLLNRFSQSVQAALGSEDVKKLQTAGLQYHQVVSVPAKGDLFLRIGVHDLNVDRIGVVEVPVSAVERLAVVDVPAPQPAERAAPTLNGMPK